MRIPRQRAHAELMVLCTRYSHGLYRMRIPARAIRPRRTLPGSSHATTVAATGRGDITTTATSILLLQIVYSNAVIASAGQEVPTVHALNGQSKHPAPVYRADLTRLRELEAHSPAGCNRPLQDAGMLQPSASVVQQPKHTTVMQGARCDV